MFNFEEIYGGSGVHPELHFEKKIARLVEANHNHTSIDSLPKAPNIEGLLLAAIKKVDRKAPQRSKWAGAPWQLKYNTAVVWFFIMACYYEHLQALFSLNYCIDDYTMERIYPREWTEVLNRVEIKDFQPLIPNGTHLYEKTPDVKHWK